MLWLVLLLWLVVRRLVAVLVVAAVLVTTAPAVAAPPPEERKREIAAELDRLRERIDDVASAELELIAALEVSRRRAAELDVVVADLDARLLVAAGELAAAEAELVAAEVHHVAVVEDLDRTRTELVAARSALRDQAVAAFVRGDRQPSALDLVLGSSDVGQALVVSALADVVVRSQHDLVDRTGTLEEDTQLLEGEAAATEAGAARQRQDVANRKADLESVRDAQAAAREGVRAEAAVEAALLGDAEEARAGFEQRVGELEAESTAITELLRVHQEAQRATRRGSGVLAYPVASPFVTSSFGYRTHPIYGGRRLHAGMDLRAPTGTPILAAAAGTVVFAGYRGGYGNAVIIDHGGSLATLYAHQSSLAVRTGVQVTRGQVVGGAGSTGGSTGPHLHFEVRASGTPVDPADYL